MLPGRNFSQAPEDSRQYAQVTSTYGITIANGPVKRGQIAVRHDIFCQNSSSDFLQRHSLYRGPEICLADSFLDN
jgi:hypothetical protein